MADVLGVIQDILNQDKQQKKEHAKMMREVQKKLKEKELPEEEGDGEEYKKFVQTMLKKFGVKSPSELAPDKKKEFYDALDAGWEGDNEEPEPEDEKKESLGDRVKARMEAEDEEDEDEPSDDTEEPEEEEDEEEEPETTEAESGKKEKVDTNPSMESYNPHARNKWREALEKVYEAKVPEPIPEVIKNVGKLLKDYAMKSGGIDKKDFLSIAETMQIGKMPNAKSINNMDTDPREFVFDLMAKTMGWKYVEQYGGIRFQHRRDYVESFQGGHVLQEHCGECGAMDHVDEKMKTPKYANRATARKEKEDRKRAQMKRVGLEQVEVDEKKMFSGKGEFEVKYASSKRGPIKVSKFNTLDDAKKFLAQVKKEGMNGIISKGGKPVKEENEEVTESWIDNDARKVERKWSKMDKKAKKKWMDGIMKKAKKEEMPKDELMDVLDDYGLTMEEVEIDEKKGSDYELYHKTFSGAMQHAYAHAKKKGYTVDPDEIDSKVATGPKKPSKGKTNRYILGTDKKQKLHVQVANLDNKRYELNMYIEQKEVQLMSKEESNLEKLERWGIRLRKEDYVKDPGDSHIDPDIDKDNDLPKNWSSKGEGKPPVTDQKRQDTEDRRAKRVEPVTKKGGPKPGKGGDLDSGTVKRIEGDSQNKLSVGTKAGKPVSTVGKATDAKVPERVKTKDGVSTMEQYSESLGMRFARKHYQKDKDSI